MCGSIETDHFNSLNRLQDIYKAVVPELAIKRECFNIGLDGLIDRIGSVAFGLSVGGQDKRVIVDVQVNLEIVALLANHIHPHTCILNLVQVGDKGGALVSGERCRGIAFSFGDFHIERNSGERDYLCRGYLVVGKTGGIIDTIAIDEGITIEKRFGFLYIPT